MKPKDALAAAAPSPAQSAVDLDGGRPPFNGEAWAARSEAYAQLIVDHLTSQSVWLDAGCGWRLLEDHMDPLEDWLVHHCRHVIGLDVAVSSHRNIRLLGRGSLYNLPFADGSFDLVTCNMVAEHLDDPARAFAEIARCLAANGVVIIKTPNLLNYGVMGNAIASKLMPEQWRLALIYGSDGRRPEDFFPVRYKANTLRSLGRLFSSAGLQIHKSVALRQERPYSQRAASVEKILMKLTPFSSLLVCAHKSGG